MDVGIDQAGKKSAIAQVDDFGASRVLYRGSYLGDAFALDQDFSWLDDVAGLHVEQARRVQHDRVRRGSRLSSDERQQ